MQYYFTYSIKKIKIIEFNENIEQFCKNFLRPLKDFEIENVDNELLVKAKDIKTRSILIGRDRKNLKRFQEILNLYFNTTIKIS